MRLRKMKASDSTGTYLVERAVFRWPSKAPCDGSLRNNPCTASVSLS